MASNTDDTQNRNTSRRRVCAVVGVGPGNGAALARRFAKEGYLVALLARTTTTSAPLAASLEGAKAYACDVTDPASVELTFKAIAQDLGTVSVLVYNAGSGSWGTVEEIQPAALEQAFKINAVGLLVASQQVIPGMKTLGEGSIVVIGATASRKGGSRSAGFAPAKAAQRTLCESMARHLWPQHIHVSLIIVDGIVDLAETRARMPDKPDDFFIKPDELAETAYHLTTQPASAWSFEVEARPFKETW